MGGEGGKMGNILWVAGRSRGRTLKRNKVKLCSELGQFSLILNLTQLFTQLITYQISSRWQALDLVMGIQRKCARLCHPRAPSLVEEHRCEQTGVSQFALGSNRGMCQGQAEWGSSANSTWGTREGFLEEEEVWVSRWVGEVIFVGRRQYVPRHRGERKPDFPNIFLPCCTG